MMSKILTVLVLVVAVIVVNAKECELAAKSKCDAETICVPTNSSFYCKLYRVKEYRLRPDYRHNAVK